VKGAATADLAGVVPGMCGSTTLSEIVKSERGVTADTALRLERYFGSEAKGWLNLQAAYELRVAEIENGKAIAKEIRPFALAT
jgi:antitoxin HigA-1